MTMSTPSPDPSQLPLERTAVCPICSLHFPVNNRHTITNTGRVFVLAHNKPDGTLCGSNGAVLPNYVRRHGDERPFGDFSAFYK